jgi:hypothetical protein
MSKLPKYQERPGTVLTYKRNPEWFDNRARYHDDPRWDAQIRKAVYSGGYGYDPTTGALYNLNKGETTAIPAATQAMSKDRRTWTQQDKRVVQKQTSKERAKEEVAKSMQQVFQNPITYAPGVVGAALFAGPAAAAGLGSALSAPLTIGSTIYPGITMGNILSAGFASDFLLNRAPQIPSQIARGEYGEAALNTGLGVLDLAGANMISPIRQGVSALASGTGRFLTTQTPLRNAWRLNPGAVNLERKIAQENIPVRQIFGDEAYQNFLKYGPSTRPGVSELEQLKDFIKLPETAVNIGRTGERMELAGLSNQYEVPYFSQGRLWYQGPSKKYMLEQGPERIIVPKNASNLKFNPAGEQDVILEPEKYLPESVDIFAGPRRVLLPSPAKKAYDPAKFDVYEGVPHWWRGYQKAGSNLPSGSFTDYLSTQTPLKNLWKLNPYAYKQQADMMYRGIGQEGFQDAIDAGYLRSKQNVEPSYYKNLNMSKQFGKNTYFSPNVETAVQYGEGVVAAIPRSSARWISRYPRQGANSWSQFTQSQIPTEMVEFYKPHWLKKLTPIENPVTPKTYPTIWSDLQGMNETNVDDILDLKGDLSNETGLFNYGVFPVKKNPNILVKFENLNRYKEFIDPNASIQSGLPELMRDITSPNISRSYMDIDASNRQLIKAIRPNTNSIYNNPQIAGRVISRVQGSPLDALLPSEMENIPTEAYQTFLDDIRMLSKKNIGLDLVGDNIMYNPETKRFGMFDLAKLPTETGNTGLSLHDLYGIGNTGNISNYRIQQYFQNKMKSALSDVTSANAGEYAPDVYSSALDKIYENIRKIKKQGGPIINQRGFMDGVPPQGSNWRIMGDGQGTSITMDLPNMPDEILVVPDGDFDQAKVMKQGEEEYFMGADFVDEYLLKDGGLTPNKAREILHDKEVHGRPLTEKQRRYFGAMSKGHTKKYQIGGKTDEEKRALAKRTVQIARRRADKGEWVTVPQDIREAADKLGEPSFSCIGGVCDVLKEADVIPRVIWSNTEFARLAPSLGFNAANRGWGLKGLENLEPGDVVQWMDPNEKNPNKAVPHHGQIYLGTNSKGELEFFDNFSETIKSYPKERIEEQLSWNRKPAESQMQIYKINPYNPKPGNVNPEAQKALEEREANLRYQTGYEGALPEYAYSLRPDSPYYNNPPIGMVKFMDKANDSEFIDDVVRSIDKAGYGKRATREQVHDSLLNVFGILGQENKWENPWVGGDVTGGSSPIPIPLESTIERIASPSSMSIGPGQIKYSQIKKPIRKAFGINRRQDLQNWDKVIPLMVGLDIANKQWMENQGERFSERIIGQPGLRSTEFKWDEGRISPYFYRGPGIKNIRKYVESLYGKDWYDKFKPQYMQDVEEMEEDPAKREQFVKDNIRQYQLVFDPGSYGQRVFENINKNLQRKILRKGEIDIEAEPMDAITLQEVILNSKRPPRRQLGGNALAMLRDYGGGISVPPLYKSGGQHGGLDRWFAEKWVDVKTGKPCGRQEGENRAYPACRPSKRVSSKTPKTSSELSSAEKEKFKRSKTSSERIPYSHKRRK